jgi:hypothetical protein
VRGRLPTDGSRGELLKSPDCRAVLDLREFADELEVGTMK